MANYSAKLKISVIIPAYNEEKNITQCLISLAQQAIPADEIVLIDNNSTDQTVIIAQKFGARIIREPTQGMIFARNRGFNEAIGQIVARCDADTVPPSDWLQKIKKNFNDYKIDALTGPIVFRDFPMQSSFYANLYNETLKLMNGHEILNGPNMALTKDIWTKIKNNVCLDEKQVHEDIDLAIHIQEVNGIIRRDTSMVVQTSGRRIVENPASFFVEYPLRTIKTIRMHKFEDEKRNKSSF